MMRISLKNAAVKALGVLIITGMLSACSQKSGCPSNGKNVGAERILSGEKTPKGKKFKA